MSGNASQCRSCGAAILWAVTTSGRRMPVDAQPHPQGRLRLSYLADGTLRVEVNEQAHERHRPHFATCPDADSWRHR